jgi:hypothetical protein
MDRTGKRRPNGGCFGSVTSISSGARQAGSGTGHPVAESFDAINHGWLVKFIEHRIADRRVVRVIRPAGGPRPQALPPAKAGEANVAPPWGAAQRLALPRPLPNRPGRPYESLVEHSDIGLTGLAGAAALVPLSRPGERR